MYNYKRLLGELFGAAIAVVWIAFGLLGAGNLVFLTVAISLTILFGVLSGGLIGLGKKEIDYKVILGWFFGAAIAVVWIAFGLLGAGNMVFLFVAISLTILFGALSGGLIKLDTKSKETAKT
ncbi:MAG: hypothetical protein ACFE85_03220 [Candidatus Hodarchaeota archaeon]